MKDSSNDKEVLTKDNQTVQSGLFSKLGPINQNVFPSKQIEENVCGKTVQPYPLDRYQKAVTLNSVRSKSTDVPMGYHGGFFHINNCKPSEMKPRINLNMKNFPWRKAGPGLDQQLDPQSLERSKLTIVKILLFLNSVLITPINSILGLFCCHYFAGCCILHVCFWPYCHHNGWHRILCDLGLTASDPQH